MEVGDQSVSTDTVMFNYADNTEMDHRMIISASGDLRFLSGVNMTTPALSVASMFVDDEVLAGREPNRYRDGLRARVGLPLTIK